METPLPSKRRNRPYIVPLIKAVLMILTVSYIAYARAPWMNTFVTYMLAILLEAVPFIIIGALIAGMVSVFLPADILPRLVKRFGHGSIPASMALAVFLPVCECGVVSVVKGLLRKGLSLPCALVYLLAAPILNPVVLASTVVAFQLDYRFVLARLLGAVFVSIPVAVILGGLKPEQVFTASFRQGLDEHKQVSHDHASESFAVRFKQLGTHARHELLDMLPYLMLGVGLAAAMQTFLGSRLLADFGRHPLTGTLSMMISAFSLSLCSEADAFVARTFYGPFNFTAVMGFLVLGPMLDIKLLLMYRTVFTRRFIIYLACSTIGGTVCYLILLGYLPA